MKRIIAFLCAFILIAGIAVVAFANEPVRVLTPPLWMPDNALLDDENTPFANSDVMLSLGEMYSTVNENGKIKFTNYVDGYTVLLPYNMQADMSMADVCASFTDGIRSLRIFKEVFETADERESYLVYSNNFLKNTADHKIEVDETVYYGNYKIRTLQWSRQALKKVKNDNCFYACVDVMEGSRVYTFFFTASKPFYMCGGYADIARSIQTFDPSVAEENAYNRGYKKSGISHMNMQAQTAYNRFFSDSAKFAMGMFAPDRYGGQAKMEEFESILDYKFAAELHYTEVIDKTGLTTAAYSGKVNNYMNTIEPRLKYARNSGKMLELTLQTPLSRKTDKNMVYEILNGEYDVFLTAYSKLLLRYSDVPILFRPFNEMNSDWCNYSAYHTSRDPQIYVELYKYLYTKFKTAGCKNLIWVWNPNEKSFPNYKWTHEQLYYPGDEYVDIYGLTGYNTGTYYEAEIWRSFDEIYEPIYKRALRINEKPMMITEFSCSSVGGDKSAWIQEMFDVLPKYDKIKLGIWWHAADYNGENIARPYFMDTPEGTMEVFRENLANLK